MSIFEQRNWQFKWKTVFSSHSNTILTCPLPWKRGYKGLPTFIKKDQDHEWKKLFLFVTNLWKEVRGEMHISESCLKKSRSDFHSLKNGRNERC